MVHALARILAVLLLAAVAAAPRAAAAAQTEPARRSAPAPVLSLERAIMRAFEQGRYERAASLIEEFLHDRPGDPQMLYNLACAYSRLGRAGDATGALYRAVKAGFRDFAHMRSDPDLDAIRGEEMYRAILEGADRAASEAAEKALASWKATYGQEGYRFEIDAGRHLAYATALDEVAHDEMRQMLQREADQLRRTLFGDPPDYFILIAVPTPRDARRIFGDDDSIGGRYEHAPRRLIARDIGGSLRHEFVHALHYAHMERLGLTRPHPLWIQEGLASLYEDYEISEDGSITFLPNERSNVVGRLAKIGRLTAWTDLFSMTSDRFMANPGRTYPQARAIFEFLADRGKLSEWYRAYTEGFDDDATGAHAFEVVFDAPLSDVERQWRDWVRRRPPVDNRVGYGDASLGIESAPHAGNDGILIERIRGGSAAATSRLRPGDVIVAVDGTTTRSILELQSVIARKQVGDRVEVRVRRGEEYFTTAVVLRPLR